MSSDFTLITNDAWVSQEEIAGLKTDIENLRERLDECYGEIDALIFENQRLRNQLDRTRSSYMHLAYKDAGKQ